MKRIFVLTTLLLLVALGGCRSKKITNVEKRDKVLVEVTTATEEDVEQIAQFTSDIMPKQENNIAPSTSVRIEQILVEVGDRVKRGQLLAVTDKTQYNQAVIQLANLETDFNRLDAVYKAGGIAKQQIDQLAVQVGVQKEAVKHLKENIELRAPISGVVTARNYDKGDLYAPPKAILQIMEISTLKIKFNVSEKYYKEVKLRMRVDISVDIFPDKEFKGRVSLIYPTIDPATRTFTIEVEIPNGKGELRPGMFSRATINFGVSKGVMVPDLSVQKQIGSNERFVFVIVDGKAERRVVKVGRQIGKRINVLSGVNAGEAVVTSGITRLTHGEEVQIKK